MLEEQRHLVPPEGWGEGTHSPYWAQSQGLVQRPQSLRNRSRTPVLTLQQKPLPPLCQPRCHSLYTGSFPAPCPVSPGPGGLQPGSQAAGTCPAPRSPTSTAPPPRAAHFPTHHSFIFLVSGRALQGPQDKAQRAEAINLGFKAPKQGSWGLSPGECDHHDLIRTQGHLRRLRRMTESSR